MSINILAVFGVCSAIVNTLGYIFYVRGVIARKTKPERSSWWIWSLLMIVAFAAQVSAGSTWSLFLTGTYLTGNLINALLSLKYGYGHFKKYDFLALLITGVGIWLWAITGSALIALIIIILIDLVGNWLTLLKSWRSPYTENFFTWIMMTIGALLGVFSVGSINLTRLIFPVYVIIPNLAVSIVIFKRRNWRKQRAMLGRKKRLK